MKAMFRWLVLSVLSLHGAAFATEQQALGTQKARWLLTRAGFAPSDAEASEYATLTHRAAVDRLLAGVRTSTVTPAPTWIDERLVPPRELRAMSDEQRRALLQKQIRMGLELRGWWLREMVATPSPLTERMTLFWHNHFASAQPKVRYSQLMYRQNVVLRRHALGRFDELLHAAAKDPAMLIYLDAATNRRGAPNENFAREVMELFTLGEGKYGEQDIKEAARAFTGWSIDPEAGTYKFRRFFHDGGEKTVLGRSGRFDGDAVLDILLAQPSTAEFIVGKLWREFVSPEPDAARVRAIAVRFRSSGWRIDGVVRSLLMQPEVIERGDDNALVKSPVDLVVGFVRQSGGELTAPVPAAVALAGMGQNLFSPPNVRGWPGGIAWINTQTLLARKQFLERGLTGALGEPDAAIAAMVDEPPASAAGGLRRRLLALEQVRSVSIDNAAWLKNADLAPEGVASPDGRARLEQALLVVAPSAPAREGSLGFDALRAVVLDPAYQLK
jgi:uncharacterized protein (DUF1800 family)